MSLFRFMPGALLLAAPLLGHTQTPAVAPAAAPRFYVGLAAYHSNYQNLGSWRQGDTGFRVPVQLVAGYQLRPRLALELGGAYSGRTSNYTYDGYYFADGYGTLAKYHYSSTTTERITAVTALARYALMHQPTHRLRVEALGGVTLLHRAGHSRSSYSFDLPNTLTTAPYDYRDSFNDLLLTAGLGLSYRLSPRFALNFDLATNYNLTHPTAFNDGFSGSTALGLRYRFGV